jgi:hypothetical protein
MPSKRPASSPKTGGPQKSAKLTNIIANTKIDEETVQEIISAVKAQVLEEVTQIIRETVKEFTTVGIAKACPTEVVNKENVEDNSIIVYGMLESWEENSAYLTNNLQKVFESIGVENLVLRCASRIGNIKQPGERPRPIVATFNNRQDKYAILNNKKNLSGSEWSYLSIAPYRGKNKQKEYKQLLEFARNKLPENLKFEIRGSKLRYRNQEKVHTFKVSETGEVKELIHHAQTSDNNSGGTNYQKFKTFRRKSFQRQSSCLQHASNPGYVLQSTIASQEPHPVNQQASAMSPADQAILEQIYDLVTVQNQYIQDKFNHLV